MCLSPESELIRLDQASGSTRGHQRYKKQKQGIGEHLPFQGSLVHSIGMYLHSRRSGRPISKGISLAQVTLESLSALICERRLISIDRCIIDNGIASRHFWQCVFGEVEVRVDVGVECLEPLFPINSISFDGSAPTKYP